jgi:hypothetical protein
LRCTSFAKVSSVVLSAYILAYPLSSTGSYFRLVQLSLSVKWLLQFIRDFLDFDTMIGHRVSLVSLSGNLAKGSLGAVYQSEIIGLDYFQISIFILSVVG